MIAQRGEEIETRLRPQPPSKPVQPAFVVRCRPVNLESYSLIARSPAKSRRAFD
jgi:hypothetical protein